MEKLFERHDLYLSSVSMEYVRYMMQRINWNARLIVIRGPKGVGKSTLIKQYIKRNFDAGDRHVLYCSADTNYFSTHTLIEVAENFVKIGGQWLFIDEVHKYARWSQEIKEIYDLYPNLHIVLSGSSLIQINDGQADLSRRILQYDMPGLSFREYLCLEQKLDIEPIALEQLLNEAGKFCVQIKSKCHPLEHFGRYLQFGYYPFYFEDTQNYYDKLDTAIKRYGRFDLKIEMKPFNYDQAQEMCALYDLKLEDIYHEKIDKSFSISPAYLQALCMENVDKTLKEN